MAEATLTELMERDPLLLEDKDIESAIKQYRDMRHKFNLGDIKAGKVGAKTPTALKGADAQSVAGLLELKIDL